MDDTFRRPVHRVVTVIATVIALPVVSFRIAKYVDAPFDSLLAGLFGLILVLGVRQAWRLSVVLKPDGVLVRNSWRDHYLPWADIRGIDREMTGRIQRMAFLMADGRVVPCDAMRGWAAKDEPRSRALVQAVTARLTSQEQPAD